MINFSFVAVIVSGWNLSISNSDSFGATLQWTSLDAEVNHQANFYIIEVKSMDGLPLDVHTVPGNTTTSVINRLKPSIKYRVAVFGVDKNGTPYKSLQSILTTSKGMLIFFFIIRKELSAKRITLSLSEVGFLSKYKAGNFPLINHFKSSLPLKKVQKMLERP